MAESRSVTFESSLNFPSKDFSKVLAFESIQNQIEEIQNHTHKDVCVIAIAIGIAGNVSGALPTILQSLDASKQTKQ